MLQIYKTLNFLQNLHYLQDKINSSPDRFNFKNTHTQFV